MARFCLGFVYYRRCARETATSCSSEHQRMPNGLQQQLPEQTCATLEVNDAGQSTPVTAPAVSQFLEGISQTLPQPILQVPVRQPSMPKRRKRPLVPACRSVRIAAMNWPRGDTQVKTKQVLMKRLGILDVEGLSHDEALLRYFSLFKGPLTDDAVKALTALCGLDVAAALPTPHA